MLKTWAKRVLIRSGATRTAARLRRNGVAILMYHSVVADPQAQSDSLGGIAHSTTIFRAQMELLASQFNPVSLDQAFAFVQNRADLPRRSVVVTFDDGYADNYEVAIPVLNAAGIPATFYITVECVRKKKLPWPSRLRHAILATPKPDWIDWTGQQWPLQESAARIRAFDRASEHCCTLAGPEQDQYVASVESQLEVALLHGPLMMNWDQVRATVRQGHIIGSHTLTHPNMAHIKPDALKREMAESKKVLEEEIGAPVPHFSYPCPALQPHWTERTVAVSRECAYETAVTTNGGLAYRGDNPLHLRRVRPSKTVDGLLANLEFAFVGQKI